MARRAGTRAALELYSCVSLFSVGARVPAAFPSGPRRVCSHRCSFLSFFLSLSVLRYPLIRFPVIITRPPKGKAVRPRGLVAKDFGINGS